jgi:hypothetical protein
MKNLLAHWRWLLLLFLYSADAHAWGLYTHLYFAQQLFWAIPLTNPRYYRAIKRFPRLVLAGACLPDLSLIAKRFDLHVLHESHGWQNSHDLLRKARGDAERAIAIGYTSHLWVDIIAHNHFVPAHETMWPNIPLATHAAAEWAMDHHVAPQVYSAPAELLGSHEAELVRYVSHHFDGSHKAARDALRYLARAEAVLRGSGLPRLCFRTAQAFDRGLQRRFNYYLSETSGRLRHVNRLLAGETPEWLADPANPEDLRLRIKDVPRLKLRHRIPLPQDFFVPAES